MPTATTSGILGIKLSVIIAGFMGGVISLTFVRELTSTQMAAAVATGTVTTHYLTPLVLFYSGAASSIENGVAFIIGVMAMNIIPGMLRLSEIFKQDPRSFFPGAGGQHDDSSSN